MINSNNNTSFARQSYESKENNIPLSVYSGILGDLNIFYNCNYGNENNMKLLAIDGTYNNDKKMNDILNIGIFNVTDGIPVNIVSQGKEGRKE